MKSLADVLNLMNENNATWLDMRFVDVPGTWQHFSFPKHEVNEDMFSHGVGFDGSSIRVFQTIDESDMLLVPDPATAAVDPYMANTVSIIADVRDPVTGDDYHRSPRHIAKRAEKYLKSTGIGDESYWGPELEFFVFDKASYEVSSNKSHYEVDSEEAIWNSGRDRTLLGAGQGRGSDGPNLGHKIRYKHGYFPVPPLDTMTALRTDMCDSMENFGIVIEKHHHEVATGGQAEINFHYGPLVTTADRVMAYKYCVKNAAMKAGKTATFMPKPLFQDNGTGMHTHQSIWKEGQPVFAGTEYAGLSKEALNYIGGLVKHGAALMAIVAPTSNSYKRLVPGYEAPTILALSARNRSAAARIAMYFDNPKAKRVEFRPPDPSCNPYLAFSAMLMAGLDGIETEASPGDPLEGDLYAYDPKTLNMIPGTLEQALNALEADHEFLLKGGVFTEDLIAGYIEYKRETEVDAIRLRPHPYEFYLTYDA